MSAKTIMIMFVFCASVFSQDFRAHNWGDPVALVIKKEKQKQYIDTMIDDSTRRISFASEINDRKGKAVLFFKADKLSSGAYLFQNVAESIVDYEVMAKAFAEKLIVKYGKPLNESVNFGKHEVTWATKTTSIKLSYWEQTNANFLNLFYIDYDPVADQTTGL